MELLPIVRVLFRPRVLALLIAPMLVTIALLGTNIVSVSSFGLTPRANTTGIATAKLYVDTPKSQLVELDDFSATVAYGLPPRVQILVDQLASDDLRASLARAAGLPEAQIDILPFGTGPTRKTPLARRLAEVTATSPRPYVVRLGADGVTPIVSVLATAPTAKEADQLTRATIATFTRHVEFDGEHRGFAVRPLGEPRVGQVPAESSKTKAVALLVAATSAWMFIIVCAFTWTQSRSRRAVLA